MIGPDDDLSCLDVDQKKIFRARNKVKAFKRRMNRQSLEIVPEKVVSVVAGRVFEDLLTHLATIMPPLVFEKPAGQPPAAAQ